MNEKLRRLGRVSTFFAKLFAAYICAFFAKLVRPDRRNIWLVSERGDDARDNGYFFYKYLRTEHPQINAWYVIKSNSADFPKIEALGNWIEYNSFRHFVFYALCKVRISSSMWGGDVPYAAYLAKVRRFLGKRKKVVFLKHGIIKDYLPQHCAEAARVDLYVCGAAPEYEYVRNNFHHPEEAVRYTGLSRFDNLHNVQTKRQILYMPTFRRWLQGKTKEEVRESGFVQQWNAALKDSRIAEMLEQQDLELIFYPHYVLQPYVELFQSENPRIKIAKFADYDVQQLLIESKLLVTDFSSVFFDFGYMGKPVIHYQFDREQYIKEHYDYTQGYFDYDAMGFGPVAFDRETLVNQILEIVQQEFRLTADYQERRERFFPLCDTQNCARIMHNILSLL